MRWDYFLMGCFDTCLKEKDGGLKKTWGICKVQLSRLIQGSREGLRGMLY